MTTTQAERFCRELGSELRRIREEAGLSRLQLEQRSGIHRNSIERYEAGADVPIMTFVRLAVAMGASCREILDRVIPEQTK